VFLDATPMVWRTTTLQSADISMLTGAFSSLLDKLGAASVRLIVLNLDLEAELLRSNSFLKADVSEVYNLLTSIQLGTIDYRNLQGRVGSAAFLARLITREFAEPDRSQTVVFLGPVSHSREHLAKGLVPGRSQAMPALYYLQYRSPRLTRDLSSPVPIAPSAASGRTSWWASGDWASDDEQPPNPTGHIQPPIDFSDAIERMMRQANGRTIGFSTPEEFAHALNSIATVRGR